MIRRRRDEDLRGAAVALRAVYLSDGYPTNWPNDPERWIAGRRVLGAWVCESDGEVVGHLALTAADAKKAWAQWREAVGLPVESLAVVSRFFVVPGERGKGIGAGLLSCAEVEAAARGLHLVLDVSEHNHAAIAMYVGRGWREVGRGTLPPGDEGRVVRLRLFVAPGGLV